MKTWLVARAAIGMTALMALPAAALAQLMPAAEIVGQPVQVTTNGVTNTVYLDNGGTARMVSAGGRTVAGTWTAANGQLCLSNGAAQECWPYTGPFQAGQPLTLTSSCGATSTWLASATNTPPPPPAQRGERGR
jgi:hypothetical protein